MTSASQASPSWHERIARARARQFVGREAELALWRDALAAAEPPFAVLWLVGPGGIGKSTLLERLGQLSREAGAEPLRLDARRLVGSQASFLDLLGAELGVAAESVLDALRAAAPRRVLLIDTAEDLGGLEDWLREHFLPALPTRCLVAVAGRRAPAPAWREDGGWAELLRVVGLRNLSPEESRRLLAARGVDLARYPQLGFETHGHPLSLALIADVLQQHPQSDPIDARAHPDVLAALLARFVHDAPDQQHRRAIEIAAHVRVTNEAVLRQGLGLPDARALFDWLAAKSFSVLEPGGLYLHDLAAHAIDADHRRRDPEAYVAMHGELRAPIIERLKSSARAERYRAAMDLSWLHRFSPVMGALIDWEGARSLRPSPLTAGDLPQVIEATRRFEGDEAADLIAHWARCRPGAFHIVRSSPVRALGYLCEIVVTGREIEHPDVRRDPRLVGLIEAARARRPLLPDERLELVLWLSFETHVDPGAMVSQTSVANIQSWFGLPGITWGGFALAAREDAWAPLMAYLDHHRAGEVKVGTRHYSLFVHDWRTVTPAAFLDVMAQREIGSAHAGALPAPREVLALSHDEFSSHVRQALRDLCSDDALRASPLARCRCVLEVPEPGSAPLRRAIELAAETLTRSGRDDTLHAALKLTYLDPSRTQEEASGLLGLPFSTYRRHLASAVERVTAWLWERDLHGYAGVSPVAPEQAG